MYEETCGFYIYKREVMTKHGKRIGNRPYIVRVEEIESIDIDKEEDFMIADAIFNYVIKNTGRYKHLSIYIAGSVFVNGGVAS